MELNPVFAMMLFPSGGGQGHELSAHFYTHDLHNPAVMSGIMRDAFAYVLKYHHINVNYTDPNIHIEPDLQMLIGNDPSKKVHWSWETFNHLLHKRRTPARRLSVHGRQHKARAERLDPEEDRLRAAFIHPGREFLTLLVHDQLRTQGEGDRTCVVSIHTLVCSPALSG